MSADDDFHVTGASEFHHSLAMSNLIDQSQADDGWAAINRRDQSSGAGHTATESVFWNLTGSGSLRSAQYGWGYVVGTSEELLVNTGLLAFVPLTASSTSAHTPLGAARLGNGIDVPADEAG